MKLNEKTVLDNNMLLKNVLVEITNKYNVFMNHCSDSKERRKAKFVYFFLSVLKPFFEMKK